MGLSAFVVSYSQRSIIELSKDISVKKSLWLLSAFTSSLSKEIIERVLHVLLFLKLLYPCYFFLEFRCLPLDGAGGNEKQTTQKECCCA